MCDHGEVSARRRTGLSADDLSVLSAGLAAGKRVTVYLRDPIPALELEAGTSARVVSIDGSTVTVSPKGVDDQLPFEADELHKTRPAARSAAPAPRRSAPAPEPSGRVRTSDGAAAQSASRPVTSEAPAQTTGAKPRPASPKTYRRTKTSAAAVSVTVTAAGEGTWTVSVLHGSRKQGKATEVSSDRVARAMHALGDEAAVAAVEGVIESARTAAQKRVDELSHELEAARAALAQLDGPAPDR
ncbi:DUF6319 family protein [Gordonia sp. PKS22-38]|uniref:DUF6319 family protein n=1 Tax=Gordonia prachuapensis TaxID=3115651 RepID=A0ABU7MY36_9ACTN|nr:DUF6319 family protein [Gordonia sp. PKS22-38]